MYIYILHIYIYIYIWGDSLLFTRNSCYSLDQSRKDERLRWLWRHPVVMNLYQPSYYQIWIKVTICQTDSIMTLNCELFQSEFSDLSGKLIIELSKMCFLCTYVDQMMMQLRLVSCFKFSFTTFLPWWSFHYFQKFSLTF